MLMRGMLRGTRQGFAFFAPDDGGEEVYVARENLGGAIHGDRVEVSLLRRMPHDFRPEAVVERILERPDPLYTGNVVRLAHTLFVVPDSSVLPPRIRLRTGAETAPHGSKILFRIEGPRPGGTLSATLDHLLGDSEDPALDSIVVATAYQLPMRFPEEALTEALAVAERDDPEDRARRVSYHDRIVLTIDPETAKDFDDALSIQKEEDGYRVQVHIADVSWYVEEGGALDAEAARRGNSVYFPGGVLPMLPEILSSRMASLVPGEDRRVMTVELDLDPDGGVRGARFHEGMIRSSARLHYEQAQHMLESGQGPAEIVAALRLLSDLARKVRVRRFEQGGFDLEIPETEMGLDARGMPVRIWRHRTFETNRIVEEFMILANRAVGRFLVRRGMPVLFRVHGEPDPAALARFAEVAWTLMPRLKPRDLETLPALRRTLADLPGGALTRIIHSFFLRSMKQAVYGAVDFGHFGLGIDRYCHFTSPIRRYPDLFNHRILRCVIRQAARGAGGASAVRRWQHAAPEHGIRCTRTEQNAERAEREIVRLKTLRWARERLGESYAGRVTGITPSGVFVEFDELPVEGFVPREAIGPNARYQEERLAFVEARTHWALRLGDAVRVQIVRVDLRERHLDLSLVRGAALPGRREERPRGRTRRKEPGRARGPKGRKRRSEVKLRPGRAESGRGRALRRPPGTRKRPRRGGGR